jgi:hypothetical protein
MRRGSSIKSSRLLKGNAPIEHSFSWLVRSRSVGRRLCGPKWVESAGRLPARGVPEMANAEAIHPPVERLAVYAQGLLDEPEMD